MPTRACADDEATSVSRRRRSSGPARVGGHRVRGSFRQPSQLFLRKLTGLRFSADGRSVARRTLCARALPPPVVTPRCSNVRARRAPLHARAFARSAYTTSAPAGGTSASPRVGDALRQSAATHLLLGACWPRVRSRVCGHARAGVALRAASLHDPVDSRNFGSCWLKYRGCGCRRHRLSRVHNCFLCRRCADKPRGGAGERRHQCHQRSSAQRCDAARAGHHHTCWPAPA